MEDKAFSLSFSCCLCLSVSVPVSVSLSLSCVVSEPTFCNDTEMLLPENCVNLAKYITEAEKVNRAAQQQQQQQNNSDLI